LTSGLSPGRLLLNLITIWRFWRWLNKATFISHNTHNYWLKTPFPRFLIGPGGRLLYITFKGHRTEDDGIGAVRILCPLRREGVICSAKLPDERFEMGTKARS
jgi:hypothetical protein